MASRPQCNYQYCLEEVELAIKHLKIARYSLQRIAKRKKQLKQI